MSRERHYYTTTDSTAAMMFRLAYRLLKENPGITKDRWVELVSDSEEFKASKLRADWPIRSIRELKRASNTPIRVKDGLHKTYGALPESIDIPAVAKEDSPKKERGVATDGDGITAKVITAIFEEVSTSGKESYADVNELRAAIEGTVEVPSYGISGVVTQMVTAYNGPLTADINAKGGPWKNIRLRHANATLPPRLLFHKPVSGIAANLERIRLKSHKKEKRPTAASARLPSVTRIEPTAPPISDNLVRGGDVDFVARTAQHFLLGNEMKAYIGRLLVGLSKEDFLELWREVTEKRIN